MLGCTAYRSYYEVMLTLSTSFAPQLYSDLRSLINIKTRKSHAMSFIVHQLGALAIFIIALSILDTHATTSEPAYAVTFG